jgi:DNA-directed RNA polymerase specialized sigma24 family protein
MGPEGGSPSTGPRPDPGTGPEPEARQRDADALAAFERFYGAHRRHVVAYCRRRTDGADALEAADETFLVAWRRWDDIPGQDEPRRARAWLYGVAYRLLGNQRRGQRRRRALTSRIAGMRSTRPVPTPEPAVLQTEEQRGSCCSRSRSPPGDLAGPRAGR